MTGQSPPPTGVLVITFWLDGTANELRLRVVSTTDIIAGAEHRFTSTDPEEVLEFVRSWLTEFGDAMVTAVPRRPASFIRQGRAAAGGDPQGEGE